MSEHQKAEIANASVGPNPPKGAFGKFEDIKPMIESVKTQSYADLVRGFPTLFRFFGPVS